MRGIERLVATLCLAGAVAGTAAFARSLGGSEHEASLGVSLTHPAVRANGSMTVHVAGLPAPPRLVKPLTPHLVVPAAPPASVVLPATTIHVPPVAAPEPSPSPAPLPPPTHQDPPPPPAPAP